METRPTFRKNIILKYLQVHIDIDYFKCRRIANSIISNSKYTYGRDHESKLKFMGCPWALQVQRSMVIW